MTTALLIIDVQQGLSAGEWAMAGIDAVIQRINAVSARARAAGVPVVLIQHEEDEGLRYGSAEWQLATALDVDDADLRVRKRTPDAFHETELDRLLHERGVDHLVACGVQSEFCVDSTVRSALALGYPVTLLSDAHATMDNGVLSAAQIVAHHNATLANVSSCGRRVRLLEASSVRFDA